MPFWEQRIAPELMQGRQVLVVAHGNSLRALVKMLDNMSEQAIVELNITAPGWVGELITYTMRGGAASLSIECMPPGAHKAQVCR